MDGTNGIKKMAVIPYDVLNTLQQNQNNLLTPPEVNHLSNLDAELKSVLFNQTLPSDIKFRKYLELLNKFNTTMGGIKKPIEIKIKEEGNSFRAENPVLISQPNIIPHQTESNGLEQTERTIPVNTTPLVSPLTPDKQRIIDGLPVKVKNKAKHLLNTLSNIPELRWDPVSREISINGVLIKDSDIENIVNDFLRDRKKVKPGFHEVVELLKQNKYPRAQIINLKAWDKHKSAQTKSGKNNAQSYKKSAKSKSRRVGSVADLNEEFGDPEESFGSAFSNFMTQTGSGKRIRKRKLSTIFNLKPKKSFVQQNWK